MGTAIYKSTDAGQHVVAFWGAPSGADPVSAMDRSNQLEADVRRCRSGRRDLRWTAQSWT
jgi:hypothetical protein